MSANKYQSIDFDLKFNDYRRILVLVQNLLDFNDNHDFNSDIAKTNEYDGMLGTHVHDTSVNFDETLLANADESISNANSCNFCEFFNYIRDNYSKIEINSQFINSMVTTTSPSTLYNSMQTNQLLNKYKKSFVYIRYKTLSYPIQLLELCEYQPFRAVYALICYSTCSTKTELLNSIKKFKHLKNVYKKNLVESKLFIIVKTKNEFTVNLSDDLQLSNNVSSSPSLKAKKEQSGVPSSSSSSTSSSPSVSTLSTPMIGKKVIEDDQISVMTFTDADTIDSSISIPNNSIQQQPQPIQNDSKMFENTTIDLNNQNLLLNDNDISSMSNEAVVKEDTADIEIELNNEIKGLENNLIYLECSDGNINGFSKSDYNKIKTVIYEVINQIYIKLVKLAELVNPNDDKQISYYSEYLKLPAERPNLSEENSNREKSSFDSILQFKVINKKRVAGRMNKHRGDLHLLLNNIESSFNCYFKSYSTLKKEQDYLWSASALLGLCAASCFYLNDNKLSTIHANSTSSLPAHLSQYKTGVDGDEIDNVAEIKHKKSNKSLEQFKSSFKRKFTTPNKDLTEFLITNNELYNNFQDVLSTYNKSGVEYSFLEFELCVMMAKYFIEKNFAKIETNAFINTSIYLTSLNIREESRVSRVVEFLCNMFT